MKNALCFAQPRFEDGGACVLLPPTEVKSERPMSEFKLKGEVDEATMLARSNFPIGPEELIFKTRQFLAANQGCSNPELLADTFQFVAPVVGPLDKVLVANLECFACGPNPLGIALV